MKQEQVIFVGNEAILEGFLEDSLQVCCVCARVYRCLYFMYAIVRNAENIKLFSRVGHAPSDTNHVLHHYDIHMTGICSTHKLHMQILQN